MSKQDEIGNMIKIVDDPESLMDKAMYGITNIFHVWVNIKQAGGMEIAKRELKIVLTRLAGSGKWVELESEERDNVLKGVVRIFTNEDGLTAWQKDAPMRDVAERAKSRKW